MPITIDLGGNDLELSPTTEWQELEVLSENYEDINIDNSRYYVDVIWE